MTPCVVNRNLKKVVLLPYDPVTQQLYVTIWGDEIVQWITGKTPHVKQSQSNKIDHASVITEDQCSQGS